MNKPKGKPIKLVVIKCALGNIISLPPDREFVSSAIVEIATSEEDELGVSNTTHKFTKLHKTSTN